jgi:acyl carrier protein
MRALWEEVLETTDVSVDWDFFEMGGNSLHAALLVDRIEELYGVALNLPDFYDHPTVHELVECIESRGQVQRSDDGPTPGS